MYKFYLCEKIEAIKVGHRNISILKTRLEASTKCHSFSYQRVSFIYKSTIISTRTKLRQRKGHALRSYIV